MFYSFKEVSCLWQMQQLLEEKHGSKFRNLVNCFIELMRNCEDYLNPTKFLGTHVTSEYSYTVWQNSTKCISTFKLGIWDSPRQHGAFEQLPGAPIVKQQSVRTKRNCHTSVELKNYFPQFSSILTQCWHTKYRKTNHHFW